MPARLGATGTPALLGDFRFYGVERVDLIARYGARCDGVSHPLAGLYGSLAAAQVAYPGAGLTSGNWSAMELDTAAWLQAESDLRNGSGGIIGLADNTSLMASQTLWLQQAGKVHFHGGRNTAVLGEKCGSSPVIRASNTALSASGPARSVPVRNLTLFAWNAGRAYFSATSAGTAAPGYATAAAMSGNPAGYRTGSCAIQIDDGGAAGQSSGLSGPASVYATIEGARWFNFDDSLRWGDNTFAVTYRNCMAENNNKGASWAQTTSLNSGENMRFEGGSYSNNNYGFNWVTIYTASSTQNEQACSLFIHDASIDYNIVSSGVFSMCPSGQSYNMTSADINGCHIENLPACCGPGPWFSIAGRLSLRGNKVFPNGTAPTGLVSIGDGSCGIAIANSLKGTGWPIFISATSNGKTVEGYANDYSYGTVPVVLMSDTVGSVMQRASVGAQTALLNPAGATFAYTSLAHGHYTDIVLNSQVTNFLLPANGANSFPVGHSVRVYNTDGSNTITTQVPAGAYCGGNNGYQDNRNGSSTAAGPTLPPKSMSILNRIGSREWAWFGPFASAYSG